MKITILTIFPAYFEAILSTSILKRAIQSQKLTVEIVNIRDFTQDKHHTTDDRPFGGGPGMIMMIEPIDLALKSLKVHKGNPQKPIILLSARGRQFNQTIARDLSQVQELVLICGHYGDVDGRVAQNLVDDEISLGDFVLTGGEPAAACIVDSVSRLIPGVLGNDESLAVETHDSPGFKSALQYTRPADYLGMKVPDVLLSGHAGKIAEWRKNQESK